MKKTEGTKRKCVNSRPKEQRRNMSTQGRRPKEQRGNKTIERNRVKTT